MARGANKQTIKFQKKNLKRTIERRRQTSKVRKQILQRKEKQKARQHKEKDAKAEKTKEDNAENSSEAQVQNTAEYFCDFSLKEEDPLDLSDDEEDDLNGLEQFAAIEEKKDSEIMEEDEDSEEEEDDEDEDEDEDEYEDEDEDEDEDMEDDSGDEDEDDMEEVEENDSAQAVTREMVQQWAKDVKKKSPSAWKQLLLALRGAARSEEERGVTYTYRLDNYKLSCKVAKLAIEYAYPILSQHLITSKNHKVPQKTKYWPKFEKAVHLFFNNTVRFLRDLEDEALLAFVLTELEKCAIYFGTFTKACNAYLKVLLDRWSDSSLSSETRQLCYSAIRTFATTAQDAEKNGYMPHALKGVYLVFAKRSTKMSETTLQLTKEMAEQAADLYAADLAEGQRHAHVYIQQLANHLKAAKKAQTVEMFKKVYTWQFVCCLDFWAGVLGVTCDPSQTGGASSMQALVQPLVELVLHTIKLNHVQSFLPLRLHLIKTLIGLVDATGYFVPLAPLIFEFNIDGRRGRTPDSEELPPFDMDLHLKTPPAYQHTKIYQDAVLTAFFDNLLDFYACFGLSIAFPELVIPTISRLKETQGRMKNTKFAKPMRMLIEKLEAQKNYVEQKRANVEYSATKLEEVNAFLRNTPFEKTPLGGYLVNKRS